MIKVSKTIVSKLDTTEEEFTKLYQTLLTFRDACNYISKIAFEERCFNPISLHHLTYKDVRAKFDLPANLVIRARDKVANAYKKNRKKKHQFRGLSMDLDRRLLSFIINEEIRVSISTIDKRVRPKLKLEIFQRDLLTNSIIKAKLLLRANELYLQITLVDKTPQKD